MEQNHLHGQRREFRIRNNAQEMKENCVKTISFSLAYLTPIKLPVLYEYRRERERETGRERFKKKKKKSKSVRNHFTVKWMIKKQDIRSVLTISMRRDVRNCRPTIGKISPSLWSDCSFGHQNGVYRSFILFLLPFFFIYLTVKWFLTDFEWSTVLLKTPGPKVRALDYSPKTGCD